MAETCNSRIIVDWLSLTIPAKWGGAKSSLIALGEDLRTTWLHHFNKMPGYESTPGPRRPGYNLSLTNETNDTTMYARLNDDMVLLEFSGRGCERLRQNGLLTNFVTLGQTHASRIDIAIDFETVTRPVDFSSTASNPRIKTRSEIRSESGETCYLGSRKSERYCRVYRYNEPHPRARYLRLEMVHRKDLAKETCKVIIKAGIQEAADRAAASYAFEHDIYKDLGASPIRSHRAETEHSNTIRWFYTQVVPAIRKMIAAEALSWEEVINALSCD